tara:strand:+ start:46138 stop:47943 length:1806 start_codon:yes stop_codon:yes gene_type:complete
MFCWRTIYYTFLAMILLPGAFNVTFAQTEFRELHQQNQLQRTAFIGLLGEFVHCAAYEVEEQDLALQKVISQAQGLTPESSGIIRVIRGGRVSQDLLYTPGSAFPLMDGDVLIALKVPTNVINISAEQQWDDAQRNQQQSTTKLTQIAIVNLLNRPVVFGVPPEIADLAGILHCLRQPLENYSQIADSIKVIPPQRTGTNADFKTKKLTSKFASGTVLVLNSHKSIDLSLVPHSLPVPRRLPSTLSPVPEASLRSTAPESVSFEKSQSQQTTPLSEDAYRKSQGVIYPEHISPPSEAAPLKTGSDQLQLNGPLLQQTGASLTLVPKPDVPQSETHVEAASGEAGSQNPPARSTVPSMALNAAPAPPTDSIQVLHDDDLSKIEEHEEKASSPSFLPQWSYYLFLAAIAAVCWKYLQNRTQTSSQNQVRQKGMSSASRNSDAEATIISRYDSLPPLPNKSLLEQILDNKIPVIEENPQIPTQTFIYGRHQSRSARIDQPESLKGPHFNRREERESTVPPKRETTSSAPSASTPGTTEKKLKSPAFRFDRSHPGSSLPLEEKTIPQKTTRMDSSNQKQAVQAETKVNSGILDRVLSAVQGVIHK